MLGNSTPTLDDVIWRLRRLAREDRQYMCIQIDLLLTYGDRDSRPPLKAGEQSQGTRDPEAAARRTYSALVASWPPLDPKSYKQALGEAALAFNKAARAGTVGQRMCIRCFNVFWLAKGASPDSHFCKDGCRSAFHNAPDAPRTPEEKWIYHRDNCTTCGSTPKTCRVGTDLWRQVEKRNTKAAIDSVQNDRLPSTMVLLRDGTAKTAGEQMDRMVEDLAEFMDLPVEDGHVHDWDEPR